MALIIKNGTVYFNGNFQNADVLINDEGRIDSIAYNLRGEESIDATDLLVLPGLIDPHVHLREPGATTKEDFNTGTRAAIAGGFTTVIDMPNNYAPTVTKARLAEKIVLSKKAHCDVRFHFGGTDDNFDEVKKANPDSLKLYLTHTTGELLLKKPDSLERHFKEFPKNKPIVLHACDHVEDESANIKTTLATISNCVTLANKYSRKIHIAHVSVPDELHRTAKYAGCTTETTPHYLFLTSNDAERLGKDKLGKVFPPLKSERVRSVLWSSLGKIDCIATDHAPHTLEDKTAGAAGFPGLETSLALMLQAYSKGELDLGWIINAMSSKPAEIFGLTKEGKGAIAKGNAGDITLVNLKQDWIVKGEELETKCKWSPFEGMHLRGKVAGVIRNGELIYQEGEFVR